MKIQDTFHECSRIHTFLLEKVMILMMVQIRSESIKAQEKKTWDEYPTYESLY